MLRALHYLPYAKEFGYTPDQVDELPADVEPYMLPLARELFNKGQPW